MGMYTELIFSAELTVNLPEEVIKTLKYMCDESEIPSSLLDHDLFKTSRWKFMFHCSSYYFPDSVPPIFRYDDISKDWRLTVRSNLKNYDKEIEKFLDWIKPYITGGSGTREFYAIVCYEEQAEPTIYYLLNKKGV